MQGTDKSNRKQITNRGIIITRIVNGKCVEDYEIYDRLYIAEQAAEGWFARRMVSSIAQRIRKVIS